MNKKGAFSYTMHGMQLLFVIITIIVISLGFLFLVNSQVHRQSNVADEEIETLNSRYFFGDCFGYDDSFRIYETKIDVSKFTEENLKKCVEREGYYVKLTLEIGEDKIEIYNDEDNFKRLNPLCSKSKNYFCSSNEGFILDSEDRNDNLKVEAILENA